MKRFLIALQFLTIIPVKSLTRVAESHIAKSASFFVIVGIVQGILLLATDLGTGKLFHPSLVAGIVLLVLVLSNGGFHLDGLADTFDAIAVKPEGDRAHAKLTRLSVMKDGSTGPAGVTAIFFALLLKYLALVNLSHFPVFTYYSSILLLPVISKWAMVISMYFGNPAREDGLGRLFIARIGLQEVIISTFLLVLFFVVPQLFLSPYIPVGQNVFYGVLLGTVFFVCRTCLLFFDKKFGGLTGDTLGAISEITEILFLLMVITWAQLFI
jgi:adenosylcobinamide-GDP ribazoletransferase